MAVIAAILKLAGALGVFLYGMKVMSEAIQKVAGHKLQLILYHMTSNRVTAVLSGFIITSIVQSSSATTVMIVSFVHASLLSLTQAIGMIMGANIGTTVTTWIVSFFGFKFSFSAITLPIIGIGLPFFFSKKEKHKHFGEVLIGFGILFLGLAFLKTSVPDIKNNPEILAFVENYSNMDYLSYFLFIILGALLTITVQSSSAAMAITVTMAFKGWISFPVAAAIVLGENIGTTITAYLASLTANIQAKRAARAHFLFNIFGVLWILPIFPFFLILLQSIVPWDSSLQENIPLNLSLFHTSFNVINTLISISFVSLFAKIVTKMVKDKPQTESSGYSFEYISTPIMETPELDIFAAKNEIRKMAILSENMLKKFLIIFADEKKYYSNLLTDLKKMEETSDQMQIAISQYLSKCSHGGITSTTSDNINSMIRIVNEIESICDSCYILSLFWDKKIKNNFSFSKNSKIEIADYSKVIIDFLQMNKKALTEEKIDLDTAFLLEEQINEKRIVLSRITRKKIQEEKASDIKSDLLYIDIIRVLEHIGNKSLNIAQALSKII